MTMHSKRGPILDAPERVACEWEGCTEDATAAAYLRSGMRLLREEEALAKRGGLVALCASHHELAARAIDGNAEYTEHCPNCGCVFGVN